MKMKGTVRPAAVTSVLGMLLAAAGSNASTGPESGVRPVEDGLSGSRVRGLSGRSSALWSCSEWLAFRNVWREMGSLSLSVDGHTERLLDPEKAGDLRIALNEALEGLRGVSRELGISQLELTLLERLARDRLDLLSYGMLLPMTRMMPPPVSDQTGSIISLIEARAGAVARLRGEGLLSVREMMAAFDSLRSSAELYFMLEAINSETRYSGVLWYASWPMDTERIPQFLDSIRVSMVEELSSSEDPDEELIRTVIEEFDAIESVISKTRQSLPALGELLLALELL